MICIGIWKPLSNDTYENLVEIVMRGNIHWIFNTYYDILSVLSTLKWPDAVLISFRFKYEEFEAQRDCLILPWSQSQAGYTETSISTGCVNSRVQGTQHRVIIIPSRILSDWNPEAANIMRISLYSGLCRAGAITSPDQTHQDVSRGLRTSGLVHFFCICNKMFRCILLVHQLLKKDSLPVQNATIINLFSSTFDINILNSGEF